MISAFVKEQQRYTRDYLKKSLFRCSDTDIIRIIKKLKGYGVVKVVKNTREQLNMSDLNDEDIEFNDEDEISAKYLYVFTFVGILIVEGRILKCYPKYIFKTSNPTDELKQVIKVLQKYKSKEQIIQMYNNGGVVNSFNRLAGILTLLYDYFENGVYTNTQNIIEINGEGEINWDRTINNTYPIISNNRPYYVELQTKRRINDELDFIKKIHECLLTSCTKEMKDADLLRLLDIEGVILTDEKLENFGDDEYILHRLEKEMSVQFNTRKQTVLKLMQTLIENKGTLDDINVFSAFGTNSFNIVWEKICAEVMENKLFSEINALGIENVNIPKDAQYSSVDNLISVIKKPKWLGYAEDGTKFEKSAYKTLIPDFISIYHKENACYFIIFDAKYYTIQLEKDEELRGQPSVGDVTKQYLYQLAYKEFVEANKFDGVINCFVLPTEKDSVVKQGSAKMDMLDALGLEQIQVRQLPAKKIFSHYLSGNSINIEDLDLL